jgi:hypothetical protein
MRLLGSSTMNGKGVFGSVPTGKKPALAIQRSNTEEQEHPFHLPTP